MSLLVLVLKRLVVLLLGFILVWFTVFTVLPLADERLPLAIALLLTYCFVAYVGLPALVRVWQLLHKPTHVPTRSLERDGWAADPINLVMIAKNEKHLVRAMQKAGWLAADPNTLRNNMRMVLAVMLHRPYPTAPFDNNYVFGRAQDLGFQIPVGNSPRKRHHVRFWRLGATTLDQEHEHQGFWRTLLKRFIKKENQVWVGAAVFDWGINARMRNLQLGHGVDGNTIKERDFLVNSLKKADVLKDAVAIKAGEPLHTRHARFGEMIITDGYVKLCEIKRYVAPVKPQK